MSLHRTNGTKLTKAGVSAVYTVVPVTDPLVEISEDLYEMRRPDGTANPPTGKWLRFHAGQRVPRSRLLVFFPDAVVESVVPAGGPAAGGTAVTLNGENFTPGATVEFGDTPATSVQVVDEKKITCIAPAGEAGTVQVTVTTDAGASPTTVAYTYA